MIRRSDRIHVDPSQRDAVGRLIAGAVIAIFRAQAPIGAENLELCPGCTMIAFYDAFMLLSESQRFSRSTCASQLGDALKDAAVAPVVDLSALAERLR